MRIGIVGPVSWRVPPRTYGGWELVAGNLAEELVRRGHEVTLFATGDSVTSARLISVVPRPLSEDPELGRLGSEWEALHLGLAFAHAQSGEFDVLHNHAGALAVTRAAACPVPVLTTLHGSGAEEGSRLIYRTHRDQPSVSITDAERVLAPELNYLATVYNGVEVERFPLGAGGGDYLVCVGRMSPDKGVHLAIEVARRAGIRLVLAGIVPADNADYFDAQIRPALRPGVVEFIGPVTHEQKAPLLAGARAFLHLITYHEAFGLTMVEALACGTPVIAARRGSVPEIVRDGRTGLIVDDLDAAVEGVARVGSLDRAECRRDVADRFSVEGMVTGYERCYQRLSG